MIRNIILLFIISYSNLLSKENTNIPNSNYLLDINNQDLRNLKIDTSIDIQTSSKENLIDDAVLSRNEKLTATILDNALENGYWDMVEHLIPIYSKFKEKDEILLLYSKAILLQNNRKYKDAIKIYKTILSINAKLFPIQLRLAEAYLQNNQSELALKELDYLSKKDDLPSDVQDIISKYKELIESENNFKFTFNANYVSDKNINETSNDKFIQLGNTKFQRDERSLPRSGKGFYYNAGVEKKFKIEEQNYIVSNIQNSGKIYFNQKDYNDNVVRLNLGYQFQDGSKTMNFLPFYQKRFFSNEKFSYTYGNMINSYISLTNRFQIMPFLEYGRNYHENYNFLDGYYFYGGIGDKFVLDNKTILFSEINLYKNISKDTSESYLRKNIRVIIYRDLPLDFSTQIGFSIANKLYDNDQNIFNLRRNNDEYGSSLSLWNKKISFYNFIPKFNVECNETKSNLNIDNYNKEKYYLSLEKNF